MLVSLILYAVMGGADCGGGIWDLLTSGPRAQRQRLAIAEAIAPIWEANHVHYHPIGHKNSSCALGLKRVGGQLSAESV